MINALWEDWVSSNKSHGLSPFQIVYGVDIVFPTSLAVLVIKLLQEVGSEENNIQFQINQMIHLEQTQEEVFHNTSKLHERIKRIYDWKAKEDDFKIRDVVHFWDARNEEKGKHGKLKNLWKGPYQIINFRGQNAYFLNEMNEEPCLGGLVHCRLKNILFSKLSQFHCTYILNSLQV